jgi:hypothetical protein
MRLSILVILILAVACGKMGEPTSGIGEEMGREVSQVSAADVASVKVICEALMKKNALAQTLQNTSYSFLVAKKECQDSIFGDKVEVPVIIKNSNDGYVFKQVDESLFYFPQIETHNSGVMEVLCKEVENLKIPVRIADNYVFFTVNSPDCPFGKNEMCISFKKGLLNKETQKIKIHTSEAVRFRLIEPRVGFYTYRKLLSQSTCETGKEMGREVSLRP